MFLRQCDLVKRRAGLDIYRRHLMAVVVKQFPQTVTLVLCHRQTGYHNIRVVREPQTIRPVS